MKTKHDPNCTYHLPIKTGENLNDICICGYGFYLMNKKRNWDQMYSDALVKSWERKSVVKRK